MTTRASPSAESPRQRGPDPPSGKAAGSLESRRQKEVELLLAVDEVLGLGRAKEGTRTVSRMECVGSQVGISVALNPEPRKPAGLETCAAHKSHARSHTNSDRLGRVMDEDVILRQDRASNGASLNEGGSAACAHPRPSGPTSGKP